MRLGPDAARMRNADSVSLSASTIWITDANSLLTNTRFAMPLVGGSAEGSAPPPPPHEARNTTETSRRKAAAGRFNTQLPRKNRSMSQENRIITDPHCTAGAAQGRQCAPPAASG